MKSRLLATKRQGLCSSRLGFLSARFKAPQGGDQAWDPKGLSPQQRHSVCSVNCQRKFTLITYCVRSRLGQRGSVCAVIRPACVPLPLVVQCPGQGRM